MDPLSATTHCSISPAGTGCGGQGWDLGPTGIGGGGQEWWQGPVLYIPQAGEGNAGPELPCPCMSDWTAEPRGAHQGQSGGLVTLARVGTQSAMPAGGTCSPSVSPPCCWVPVECPLPSQTHFNNSDWGSTLGLQNSLEHGKDMLLGSPCLNTAGTEPGLFLMGPGQCWPRALPACSSLTKCQLMFELPLLPLPVPITADLLCGHPGGPGLCLLGSPGQVNRR